MCDAVYLEGMNCTNFRYTGDTALIADSEQKLQRLLNVITKEIETWVKVIL